MLAGAGRTAWAQPVAGTVPVVDRLSVRMVTDNYTDRYSVPQRTDGMKVERAGGTEKPGVPPRTTLQAEWGLSMFAESLRGGETRRMMVDFGYSPEVLLTNIGFLGVDPASLDALVLSHGHQDHFGGLVGFLDASKGKLKPGLPLFVGGEDCFCTRQAANIVVTSSTQLGSITATVSPGDTPCSLSRPARASTAAANATLSSRRAPSDTHRPPGSAAARRAGIAAI